MSKAISRISLAIIAIIVIVGGAAYAYYTLQPAAPQQAAPAPKPAPQPQQPVPKPAPAPVVMEKFKASGYFANLEGYFLVVETAKDRGIWAANGLDPEFVLIQGRRTVAADIKEQAASGIKLGLSVVNEVMLARSNGVPVKIVASYTGEVPVVKFFVKADGPIKTVKDLDGKKIGVASNTDASYRQALAMSNKFGIKVETVPLGNVTNELAALRAGRIDALYSAETTTLRLVDSGELKVIVSAPDYLPKPYAAAVVWATDDLIQQNPDLVKRFVKATLEATKYIKENPNYASDMDVKKTNVAKDLADKAIANNDWQPSGRGSGQDLLLAVRNAWQVTINTGAVPAGVTPAKAEDAVDARFL